MWLFSLQKKNVAFLGGGGGVGVGGERIFKILTI
jgi:hypothetical protein